MRKLFFLLLFSLSFLTAGIVPELKWKQHDRNRPLPPIVTPATPSVQSQPGKPPSDSVVLFDGKDLSAWVDKNGNPTQWKAANGYMETMPHSGAIHTKQSFGDCQLHLEWATPNPPHGEDQNRGNSGVYLMSKYEIQILDSYKSITYADGQAASVYGQYPPLANVTLSPGEWQTYDVVFHGPRFAQDGTLLRPATVTLLHNGVLVQDHVILTGPSDYKKRPPYQPHAEKLPLALQDHDHPVRFRNIWIRELKDTVD